MSEDSTRAWCVFVCPQFTIRTRGFNDAPFNFTLFLVVTNKMAFNLKLIQIFKLVSQLHNMVLPRAHGKAAEFKGPMLK